MTKRDIIRPQLDFKEKALISSGRLQVPRAYLEVVGLVAEDLWSHVAVAASLPCQLEL